MSILVPLPETLANMPLSLFLPLTGLLLIGKIGVNSMRMNGWFVSDRCTTPYAIFQGQTPSRGVGGIP